MHFLASPEVWDSFFRYRDNRAGSGVAALACIAMLQRKGAKAAQLDPISASQSGADPIQHGIYNILQVSMEEVRIPIRHALNKFRFDHPFLMSRIWDSPAICYKNQKSEQGDGVELFAAFRWATICFPHKRTV